MIATLTEAERWGEQFICHTCAEVRGGKWPAGHVATSVSDVCGYCGKFKSLVNIGDYDWPDGVARGMRD